MKPERMIGLAHPDEIEIRRLEPRSKEEAADIRAELEARGFTVIVRESGAGLDAPSLYHADIFAEKRTVPTEAELASRRAAQAREEEIKRRDYRRLRIVLGILGHHARSSLSGLHKKPRQHTRDRLLTQLPNPKRGQLQSIRRLLLRRPTEPVLQDRRPDAVSPGPILLARVLPQRPHRHGDPRGHPERRSLAPPASGPG